MRSPISWSVALGVALALAPAASAQSNSPAMGETATPPVGATTPSSAGGREGGTPPAALNMEGVPAPVRTPPAARDGDLGNPPSNLGEGTIGGPPAIREERVAPAANPRSDATGRERPGSEVTREVFTDQTRTAITSFYRDNFERTGTCPPGFAHGANTCAPDARTARTIRVGEPIPASVTVEPVPRELVTLLPPAPAGFVYGYTNGEIVLYELDTREVADSVSVAF
ncbi:MAG TPA: DUF1236 domain-containing protein [Candidatus Limnocylindrales bacterium]|nr:DUF1236 domain-containing protein [Candidatus Limnocylindrales bacterium]